MQRPSRWGQPYPGEGQPYLGGRSGGRPDLKFGGGAVDAELVIAPDAGPHGFRQIGAGGEDEPPRTAAMRRSALACAAATAFITVLVLLGWGIGSDPLRSVIAAVVPLVVAMIVAIFVATTFVTRALDRADATRLAAEIELRLRSQIVDELAEGVCVIRWRDSTIVYANARLDEIVRVAPGSLVGGPSSQLCKARRDDEELTREVREVLSRDGRWSGEIECRRADGAHGHGAGDALIVRIAQSLRSRLRESDVLARLGGDEFAVLLPQAGRAGAEAVAGALRDALRLGPSVGAEGEPRRITASIGIACFEDEECRGAEEIMVNADLAMYDAKEHGRDRVAVYDSEPGGRPEIERRMKWATEIREALREDRFELLAQPIVALHADEPLQFELLIRLRNGAGDLIPPGSFLYVAERLGLVQEIDRWVVARAIDLLASSGGDLRLEVNLSGHTIGDPEILELIERRLAQSGVCADRLILEVTETAAVANIARAAAFAERLCELGCRFALDDFGAGFGSFYYLKHLPFDYLKIDGEFVRQCATNETDRILIAAVVQIARGMGKLTIAEFVEGPQTVAALTALGVDYGQGFHLGRPAPLAEHLAAADRRAPAA